MAGHVMFTRRIWRILPGPPLVLAGDVEIRDPEPWRPAVRRTARNCLLPDWRLRPAGFVSRSTPLPRGNWWRPGRQAKAVQDFADGFRRMDTCDDAASDRDGGGIPKHKEKFSDRSGRWGNRTSIRRMKDPA